MASHMLEGSPDLSASIERNLLTGGSTSRYHTYTISCSKLVQLVLVSHITEKNLAARSLQERSLAIASAMLLINISMRDH